MRPMSLYSSTVADSFILYYFDSSDKSREAMALLLVGVSLHLSYHVTKVIAGQKLWYIDVE